MRVIYLDCGMGAAGDMLAAALYELLDEEGRINFIETMNSLIPGKVQLSVRPETKCGIIGTHFDVLIDGGEEHSVDHHEHMHEHDHNGYVHHHCRNHDHKHLHDSDHIDNHHRHDHDHHSMADIEAIINGFTGVSDEAKAHAINVYKIIAEAESAVHGRSVAEIHFHEVGTMDAVIDVTAVCILIDMIRSDKVYASAVRTGKGHVRCAHGILPVPAPATARILLGIPTYAGNIDAELCTPTGAALIRNFTNEFREQPVMAVSKIGYGMGTKDFEIADCVRAFLGETY